MIRKFIGPVLGIVGLVAIAVGGVALLLRPAPVSHPSAELGTVVAVIPPSVVAIEGLEAITVTAPGGFDVRTARPSDAYAWAAGIETSAVRGLESWEEVQVDRAGSTGGEVPAFPGDIWRGWSFGYQAETVEVASIEPGVAVVIVSGSGLPLTDVSLEVTHERGSGWAWPVLALGLLALAVALAFVVADLVTRREDPREAAEAASQPARKGTGA